MPLFVIALLALVTFIVIAMIDDDDDSGLF